MIADDRGRHGLHRLDGNGDTERQGGDGVHRRDAHEDGDEAQVGGGRDPAGERDHDADVGDAARELVAVEAQRQEA